MKLTLIVTILNEEKTIDKLLESIFNQTVLPDQVIIVDGGSIDNTISNVSAQGGSASGGRSQMSPIKSGSRMATTIGTNFKKKGIELKLIIKKGNRAVGRNEAVRQAKGAIILCTDAGCILDEKWVEEIVKPFIERNAEVVAGYYKGVTRNVFQKCLIPYVFVMEDKLNPETFLPASRSMAFRKKVWERLGGFNERLSHNEDYEFAKRLQKNEAVISFKKSAIVYWIPRNSFQEAYIMFYRFAYGDIEAGIIRPKVALVFIRYLIGAVLLAYSLIFSSYLMLHISYIILIFYIFWSIVKNYKYVKEIGAFYYLPLLQLTSDTAVIIGSLSGVFSFIKVHLDK